MSQEASSTKEVHSYLEHGPSSPGELGIERMVKSQLLENWAFNWVLKVQQNLARWKQGIW